MDKTTLFLIDDKKGFTPTFSHLVSMMNYTRDTTLRAVQGLTIEELDFLVHPKANSIGMLLAHFAAVEKYYQIHTFENREMNEDEEIEILAGLELGEKGQQLFRGQPLEYYLKELEDVRRYTFEKFQALSDEWLFEQSDFWNHQKANNYFKWFHVFEDELSHRGQIRMIKKLQPIMK
ncbi:Protein of unknown function [Bacillus sp. cl95]|nr:Protein of unknown function [Bacillus sp. UNCCL13]SFQ58805.1 Protein of unknown function [Bacillus sp. cl95]